MFIFLKDLRFFLILTLILSFSGCHFVNKIPSKLFPEGVDHGQMEKRYSVWFWKNQEVSQNSTHITKENLEENINITEEELKAKTSPQVVVQEEFKEEEKYKAQQKAEDTAISLEAVSIFLIIILSLTVFSVRKFRKLRIEKDLELTTISKEYESIKHKYETLLKSSNKKDFSTTILIDILFTLDNIHVFKSKLTGKSDDYYLQSLENQLKNILYNHGVEEKAPKIGLSLLGNDELSSLCEIIEKVESDDSKQSPGTILEVLSPAYLSSDGHILKKAKVKVYNR